MAAIRIQTGQESPPPTPEPMDIVYNANMVMSSVGDGQWRPMSSISRNGLTTDSSEPENPDVNEEEGKAVFSLRNKSRVSILEADPVSRQESPLRVHGLASSVPRDPPPTRATSTVSHKTTNGVKRRLRLRTAPGKLQCTTELDRAFATMHDRTRVTFEGIRGNTRTTLNDDRVCRPYSVYTVTKQCERLAISPFGGPLNSAAGRYRERYLNKHRPDVIQGTSRGSIKIKFQRFYDNLDLLAINVKRTPYGTLRKPPPKQARKVEEQTKSVPTQLHKYTNERVANLHESMGRHQEGHPSNQSEGKKLGVMSVEYKVAMEVSSNLEKHRRSRPATLPGIPNYIPGRTDAPRLQNQTERRLTPGEMSLKDGISTNLYDQERSKRGPIKAIEKPPRRVKSPPLSKLSRERFLPEAQQRRKEGESWTQLRIGRPVTPPASEYTVFQSASFATTVRPLTAMTSHNGESENTHKTKSAKRDKTNVQSNQENETEKADECIVQKPAPENDSATNDNESDDTKTNDKISENNQSKPSEDLPETSDCSINENAADSEITGQNDETQENSTPLSSTSLIVTVPGDEGAPEADTMAIGEGVVEVMSEDEHADEGASEAETMANEEGGIEVKSAVDGGTCVDEHGAIEDEENTASADPCGSEETSQQEHDKTVNS
ncbi:protein SPT2 homolog [Patiria miniata]|uniref:Uncharacterized protein n=1 Tax=Patiria miniata TaxID=46514 RepID=A0A914B8X1_PATMI|nr:protein SPT2 homolog [Patiria miniata]